MVGVSLRSDGLHTQPQWKFEQAKNPTCKRLFGRKRDGLPGQRREICTTIEAAEDDANALFKLWRIPLEALASSRGASPNSQRSTVEALRGTASVTRRPSRW